MTKPGTDTNPLRVAIVGSGPAAFYAADHLLKQASLVVEIDMLDRLPTPFGLVRAGVAPDHQKIKTVTKAFDQIANRPNFRFYGNVEFGKHVRLADLKEHYHQILFATGAQTDRHMGIPGEDLKGSHPATEFVAWYNGHPDYCDYEFDLSQERAAVVGVGNVAIDVARILCRTTDELAATDMADYALEAMSQSRVKEVYLLGRRGPAQAAFTNPEVKEVGEMADADVFVLPDEAKLDELSQAEVDNSGDRTLVKKVKILQGYALRKPAGKSRKLTIRFLVSPVELIGDAAGRVLSMRLVRNALYRTEAGTLSPKPTDQFEELPVGLVFRSVGYRGVALPEVPFNERWGVILNQKGRVVDPETQQPMTGLYTSGWIKRGPSGVIGTNKPDSVETVGCMLEDLAGGAVLQPANPDHGSAEKLVCERQPQFFTYADWQRLDEMEVARGKAVGRPRLKFTRVEDMLAALGR
ncbi:MAG TPA: FAD-dependent oxidoreductase [Anaerolineae bacterium]|nr:FAD-dependent oxidoreductase [Anaerolineae bacterium]